MTPSLSRLGRGLRVDLPAIHQPKPKQKYCAKRTEVDGISFASRMEAAYYAHLRTLQKAGEVESFDCQPKFQLQPGYTDIDGKKVRPIHYVADFLVRYADGTERIVDVKGSPTAVFHLKRKMFGYVFRTERIVCVTKTRNGWREWT